jgi:hypothetical protein
MKYLLSIKKPEGIKVESRVLSKRTARYVVEIKDTVI